MFEVEGKDGVIPTLGDGWSNPSVGIRGGFCRMVHSGETLVWIFCGLGNAGKNYAVISWLCTKGSVH
jgi:hypothetical protein